MRESRLHQVSEPYLYANMAADIVTDILIMSIPLMIVWNVSMPWRKKVLLFGILSPSPC